MPLAAQICLEREKGLEAMVDCCYYVTVVGGLSFALTAPVGSDIVTSSSSQSDSQVVFVSRWPSSVSLFSPSWSSLPLRARYMLVPARHLTRG